MTTIDKLKSFANKHSVILEQQGECGFGRPCVGFIAKSGNYIDYNPIESGGEYKDIFPYDDRLNAPEDVTKYHKHDCMAVLVNDENYEEGLEQLLKWVESLESKGEIEIIKYKTGATGLQEIISGAIGYTIRFKKPKEQAA